MTVAARTSHALFFNGVSDGVIVPQGAFDKTGVSPKVGTDSARSSMTITGQQNRERNSLNDMGILTDGFSVEAWVAPDCGGVVAVKDGMFELRIGAVGRPAPASFTVYAQGGDIGTVAIEATTGDLDPSSGNYTTSSTLYPRNGGTFLTNDNDKNKGHRELLHIVGIFNSIQAKLYINGELMATEKLSHRYNIKMNENDLFIGGRGGQFRGYIEGVHLRRGFNESGLRAAPLIASGDTVGLWRFEEPVEVDSNTFYMTDSPVAGATTFTISTVQAQTLYQVISGKNDTLSGVYTPTSHGNYQVAHPHHSGGAQIIEVVHRPFNLLINPTCTDLKTGAPNNKPPERVRLTSLNSDGTVTIDSIHLDFATTADTGTRGLLHGRTALDTTNNLANDSAFVLIKADLLIDTGTGRPYRPPGLGTQAIDRTGQMVVDESGGDNHGFFYSSRMSVGASSTINPFSVSPANWTADTRMQVGHCGRHVFSHVSGHPFLHFFPPATEEIITRTMDGMADKFRIHFDGQSIGLKEQVPINSPVDVYRQAFMGAIMKVKQSEVPSQVSRTGMSGITNAEDGIIAIGGSGFDIRPFLLKGYGYDNVVATDSVYDLHLQPEDESRIAILQTADSNIPYVEIHYNAIDLLGTIMGSPMNGPCLLIEKTVPAGGTAIAGSTVAARIQTAVTAGTTTLHAAGGIVTFSKDEIGNATVAMKPHRLVGDNTGGRIYEMELDTSRTPPNHTPVVAGDLSNSPPTGIDSSHAVNAVHPSVYHKMIIRPRNRGKQDPPPDDAPRHYRESLKTSGLPFATQYAHVFEVFDIIDNFDDRGSHSLIVQPANRSRTMQLSKISTDGKDGSHASVEYLQCRGRMTALESEQGKQGRQLTMRGRGLMDDIVSLKSDYSGDGSPDSHTIKEIRPDGPVVTVTLGGPGQGAVNTKPTYDPSPLSRVGWSTRRDGAATINKFSTASPPDAGAIAVQPLNNASASLAGWGTYPFPAVGRIYLESGAHAEYYRKTGDTFFFYPASQSAGAVASIFVNADGTESDTFEIWRALSINGITVGKTVFVDGNFSEGATCPDGTTVNDRLFQSLGGVSHDHQLGTQYASTRSIVEIPLFPQQFFEDRTKGIYVGPDNSMKLHLDCTMTAHTWAPNPVGRRCPDTAPADRELMAAYHKRWSTDSTRHATTVTRLDYNPTDLRIYLSDIDVFPDSSTDVAGPGTVRGYQNTLRPRRVYLPSGEWALIKDVDYTNKYLQLEHLCSITVRASDDFFKEIEVGNVVMVAGGYPSDLFVPIADDPTASEINNPLAQQQGARQFKSSAGREFRSEYYHDRANVQTQGGNMDYGLRQYVSAVEFKAGPATNPHLPRIQSGAAQIKLIEHQGSSIFSYEGDDVLPSSVPPNYYLEAYNEDDGNLYAIRPNNDATVTLFTSISQAGTTTATSALDGHTLTLKSIIAVAATTFPHRKVDGLVNRTWNYSFTPGGLRYGDTVWMNMHYTNPHAIEGLFCKSRGILNEWEVWDGFNGGRGDLAVMPRVPDTSAIANADVYSLPLENFLIGDTCIETAKNFTQHVNKTIALNWSELGHTDTAPVIAYLDPYLSTEQHARVLLYDVAHDREFISFHDIHMQVQSSARTPTVKDLDASAGFMSQNRNNSGHYTLGRTVVASDNQDGSANTVSVRASGKTSQFMEAAYAHRSWYLTDLITSFGDSGSATKYPPMPAVTTPTPFGYAHRQAPNYIEVINHGVEGVLFDGGQGETVAPCPTTGGVSRLADHVCCPTYAQRKHLEQLRREAYSDAISNPPATNHPNSTFFDTPDGTRVIPAFLCLKGKRTSAHTNLTSHAESRLQHLKHWSEMDFVRRLSIDLGEVGVKEGVSDINAAVHEIVRFINQAAAPNGRTNARRPADQYPGESEKLDVTTKSTERTVDAISTDRLSDPTAAHHAADLAVTGSTHDPAAFWNTDAFTAYDRGSHMGYLRAHMGRVIEDINGNQGYSIIIHSTIPGATGRNFCAWLDNSKGQTPYRPQFLIGHGGRFRNFWCSPHETLGENMHPAPMPLDRNSKPFAPITTLQELIMTDDVSDELRHNTHVSYVNTGTVEETAGDVNIEVGTGRAANTIFKESFEKQGLGHTIVEGLRVGTQARARLNCGGLVASGVPGWAPDAGRWGMGFSQQVTSSRFASIYGEHMASTTAYGAYVPTADVSSAKDDSTTVGTQPMYGFRFVDHRGRQHIIRLIYRQYGKTFANDNTILPPSIENEVIIYFDDRDVSQGGFTVGKHMWNTGDPSGNTSYASGSAQTATHASWKGNLWEGVQIPKAGYAVTLDASTYAADSTTLSLGKGAGIGYRNYGIWHDIPTENFVVSPPVTGVSTGDVLGYLGFPDSGLLWVAIPKSAGTNYQTLGQVFHYTSRTHNAATGAAGQHEFYGITGGTLSSLFASGSIGPSSATNAKSPVIISPMLNQTTILTDEIIAAAIETVLTEDPNGDKPITVDCSEMYAGDGRTFGEIMGAGASTAIRIKTFSSKNKVIPLKELFEVSREKDWGIYAGMVEKVADVNADNGAGTITNTHLGGLTAAEILAGKRLDCGYLPRTVLNITTRYRGTNANTATPILIDSQNVPVDLSLWRDHLQGRRYTRFVGDHILPALENPMVALNRGSNNATVYDDSSASGSFTSTADVWELRLDEQDGTAADPGNSIFLFSPPGRWLATATRLGVGSGHSNEAAGSGSGGSTPAGVNEFSSSLDLSFSEKYTVWMGGGHSATVEGVASKSGAGNYTHAFFVQEATMSKEFAEHLPDNSGGAEFGGDIVHARVIFSRFGQVENASEFGGIRLHGSAYSQPLIYFRGGSDSPDHSVPLYFGGGFSGAVMDINDGTKNDYSSFYDHPYATGPTGTAGMQNLGEKMGSFAILDTTAMLAMFPGTALLDQHHGESTPPFFNQQALLSPDLDHSTDTLGSTGAGSTGIPDVHANYKNPLDANEKVLLTRPAPIVLKFAHPYARYTDSINSVAYVIFGPGQSVPKHWHGEGVTVNNSTEPSVKHTVEDDTTYTKAWHMQGQTVGGHVSATSKGIFLPNELSHGGATMNGYDAYLPPTDDYTATTVFPYTTCVNWEPAAGAPNTLFAQNDCNFNRYVSDHFRTEAATSVASLKYAHPFNHYHSQSVQTDHTMGKNSVFHMDGGFAPGGNWFDNLVRKNPRSDTGTITNNARTVTAHGVTMLNQGNATMFRVGYAVISEYDHDLDATPHDDIFVIDATRVQNSEELATTISAAINTWPGPGNLKALGGTFLPSFQDAVRQDRYRWIEMPKGDPSLTSAAYVYAATGAPSGGKQARIEFHNPVSDHIPTAGHLRVVGYTRSGSPGSYTYAADGNVYYGFYHGAGATAAHTSHHDYLILGKNHRTGYVGLEKPDGAHGATHTTALPAGSGSTFYKVYVWAKSGNLRWDNGAISNISVVAEANGYRTPTADIRGPEGSMFDAAACTQVHFSGFVDAIDRTRPIGAVGWHGERYSYLNSLPVIRNTTSTPGVAAGLGAYHQMLGFSPYGNSMGCHFRNATPFSLTQAGSPPAFTVTPHPTLACHTGVHPNHYVVVSYEGELPIIAKADRDGILRAGDMLNKKWGGGAGGTITVSHEARHNNDRYTAWSNGGPHVDVQHMRGTVAPVSGDTIGDWHGAAATASTLFPADTCLFPTGDLFFDTISNPAIAAFRTAADAFAYTGGIASNQSFMYNRNSCQIADGGIAPNLDFKTVKLSPHTFWYKKAAAQNFLKEHIVWKRMSGGNVSMPALNARGLGGIPKVVRKCDTEGDGDTVTDTYREFGETIYGNVRFSFETTNSVMFPIIQAQELAQPQIAEQFPYEVKNALQIPNEEIQFEEIEVLDDTGQTHVIKGGSPFGTIIRDFKTVPDRADTLGLAPAEAGSGDSPNITIQLPDPDTIPGNIIVRSGFDRLQAYQHESMGTGGMHRPSLPDSSITSSFTSSNTHPSGGPTWGNKGWEQIDPDPNNFPDSKVGNWEGITNNNPLKTSYEPHDRALFFHVTRMGYTATSREPVGYYSNVLTYNPVTFVSSTSNTIVASGTIRSSIWQADATPDGRSFLMVDGKIASFTGVSGSSFTGVIFGPDWVAPTVGSTIKPSWYLPAGSTRHFAARRLRDHAEVSGESPDAPLIDLMDADKTAADNIGNQIRAIQLTPMPLPRMGHHYVNPTLPILPGHLAHPLYQRIYSEHFACSVATTQAVEKIIGYDNINLDGFGTDVPTTSDIGDATLNGRDNISSPLIWFSTTTAPFKPSDIHGDGFTLMFESKVRYDGYGIAAYSDSNKDGGPNILLEKGTNYSTEWNFPDPLEVGAYQIIIQPNLFAQQLMGNNANEDFGATGAPTGTVYPTLTGQQTAVVLGLDYDATTSTFSLILDKSLMADIRGCEIYINELMLDFDPAPSQQFTSIPPLGLFNPLGVNEATSPSLSRRSLPYRANMFRYSTPGYTLTIPWWAPAYKTSTVFSTSMSSTGVGHRRVEHYHPDDYYSFCRSTYGSIGSQITLAGYPTHYLDYYTHYYSSFAPTCTVVKVITTESTLGSSQDGIIATTNVDLFPQVGRDYHDHKLSITNAQGVTYTASYTNRGYPSGGATQQPTRFFGVSGVSGFWTAAAVVGATIRLTSPAGTLSPGEIYTKSDRSIATRNLPQTLSGSRDTNTLHLPDAYLCLWHPNLGRPMTWFSDSRGSSTAAAVDKKPYNHLPEFFEMVHYHDFTYAISDGPFDLGMKWWSSRDTNTFADAADMNAGGGYGAEARTNGLSQVSHFGAFWPGGSRFGAMASALDLWGTAYPGWGKSWDDRTVYQYASETTVGATDSEAISENTTAASSCKRNAGFGYRFAVRQPYNRPRWAILASQGLLDPHITNTHFDHSAARVRDDSLSQTTYTETTSSDVFIQSTSSTTTSASHIGIMERMTNASALVGSDLKLQQVRYSHGRRITKPYGCAIRNYVNPTISVPHHQGDMNAGLIGTNIVSQNRSLALAISHYCIDWWGNTTGEDVRRYPVRSFGIRPSWDPEDAYRATDRTKSAQAFMNTNTLRGVKSRAELDFFDPATAKRVGDRGDGRGVRWSTAFNEDMLQEVDTAMDPVGVVLSHHTAEPAFTPGYIRPRNDDLQNDEVPRGISRRLGVAHDDGLLKPQAMAGSNVEKESTDFLPASETLQEPISRISPRIGLDFLPYSELNFDTTRTYVAIGSEAHSLHTDRGIGRRYVVAAGLNDTDKGLGDFDLTRLNFGSSPQRPVMRLNHAHGLPPLGGTLILELLNYMEPITDAEWGRASGLTSGVDGRSSNPYQTASHNPTTGAGVRTNMADKSIKFLIRPVRVLDHRHIEIFRPVRYALSSTAGGRYGVFTYDTPNARASSDRFVRSSNPAPSNPPYPPAYLFSTTDYETPVSVGPNIPGSEATTFNSSSLKQTVARLIPSLNTLQHFRGDASRRQSVRVEDEPVFRLDYSIQPRYTQSVYPGDSQNTSNHAGESSHTDNKVTP